MICRAMMMVALIGLLCSCQTSKGYIGPFVTNVTPAGDGELLIEKCHGLIETTDNYFAGTTDRQYSLQNCEQTTIRVYSVGSANHSPGNQQPEAIR